HPGANVSHAATLAPGPKELGGYQLSLIDMDLPAGLRAATVGQEGRRNIVQHTWKHPFSAVGRLFVKLPKGTGQCTATLIGDNRTILTARHCAGGTAYYFAQGNSDPDKAI